MRPAVQRGGPTARGAVSRQRDGFTRKAVEETAHRSFSGWPATGAAHAVGDRGHDSAGTAVVLADGCKIVVGFAPPLLARLAEPDFELVSTHAMRLAVYRHSPQVALEAVSKPSRAGVRRGRPERRNRSVHGSP